jgi:glycosyltransferase involved in cell wall biosynthesis
MRTRPNAAIGFHAESFSTSGPRLMGRHAASEGFLRGWVRHAGVAPVAGLVLEPGEAETFRAAVTKAAGREVQAAAIPPWRPDLLDRIGAVMLPDPNLRDAARRRALTDPRGHSIIGLTHTTASHGAMSLVADLLTAPVEPWDALICTSEAVRGTVRALLEAEAERLAARLGAARFVQPRFPVIPLGVDTAAFAPDAAARAEWRARLGCAEGETVALWMGRLSWHAKAHPLPHFAALGRASAGRRLRLVLAGWFAHPGQEQAFRAQHAALAPEVGLSVLDGREAAVRQGIWHAADLFLLLVDNIQETFGLAPVEAMAAGLPCVVSDWDGFRDTVRDGVDGFRIPTWMTPPGSAADLALAYAAGRDSYDHYVAGTTQLAAVDVARAAEAVAALADDAGLRARMGAAARERARGFDWAVVVARTQELIGELAERRLAAGAARRGEARWMEPARGFAHYASATFTPGTQLEADPAAAALDPAAIASLPAAFHAPALATDAAGLAALAARLRRDGPIEAGALSPRDARAALWLVKSGLARVVPG